MDPQNKVVVPPVDPKQKPDNSVLTTEQKLAVLTTEQKLAMLMKHLQLQFIPDPIHGLRIIK